MKKIADFIVNKRYGIIGCMMIIAIACAFFIAKVDVNTDMTKYLPDDSNMKLGMDIMESDFPDTESYQTIRVMFDDLTDVQKKEALTKLENLSYVHSVSFEEDSENYNLDNHTLYVLNTEYDYGSKEEISIESALEQDFAGYSMVWKNDDVNPDGIPAWIIVSAISVLLVILFVMCGSWIEPFLFLAVIGVAIVINMGTNIILGSVSSITFSIAAILQLILSMDYSIILINRYRQEKAQTEDNQTAMKEALIHAFSSIASSSMTTVVGLLMLVFMSFKIGMDLGIVLAKGVFISMVCVMSIMPGVILAFDKLIQKTAKKELHIPMNWAAGFSYRMRPVIGVVFVFFFAAVCFMQSRTEIAYTLQSEDPIAEVFPTEDTLVVIYDSADEEAISQLSAELEENNNIKSVMGYYTQLARPYTAEELAEKIAEMSDSMTLDSSVIGMLYYNYYESGNAEMMTVSDFLHFISDVAVENDTFSGYID